MSDLDLTVRPSARLLLASAATFPAISERIVPAEPSSLGQESPESIGRSVKVARSRVAASTSWSGLDLQLCRDLADVREEWRAFEREASCTVFQSFDWLATWQRHIGTRSGTLPAVILGRDADGETLFILPLAIEARGLVRRLCWLGSDLCDYNAPLLGRRFSQRLGSDRFVRLWPDIIDLLQNEPRFSFDVVDLQKMPETIGGQRNPFLDLQTLANPSGAYVATLGRNWEEFYAAKRSSSTRKRERRQLKHLAEHGEIRFVDVDDRKDIARTLDTLIGQKTSAFARMGVENIFARPGYREFFLDVATDPGTRELIHVSRLEVGDRTAAANLGLRFRACYYLILSSYHDGELARLGPGRAHLHELLRHAIDRGFQRFDFTIGDEPYKRDWSDIELRLHDHLAAVTIQGWLVMAMMTAFRRAKRFIKQTPAMWHAFSKARALAGLIGSR